MDRHQKYGKMNATIEWLLTGDVEDIVSKNILPLLEEDVASEMHYLPIVTPEGDRMELDVQSGRLEFEDTSMGGSSELYFLLERVANFVREYQPYFKEAQNV